MSLSKKDTPKSTHTHTSSAKQTLYLFGKTKRTCYTEMEPPNRFFSVLQKKKGQNITFPRCIHNAHTRSKGKNRERTRLSRALRPDLLASAHRTLDGQPVQQTVTKNNKQTAVVVSPLLIFPRMGFQCASFGPAQHTYSPPTHAPNYGKHGAKCGAFFLPSMHTRVARHANVEELWKWFKLFRINWFLAQIRPKSQFRTVLKMLSFFSKTLISSGKFLIKI